MALWDPRVVLDLHRSPTSSTCSGKTKQGLRCRQSMISYADRAEAAEIMDFISYLEPQLVRLDTFEDLAYLTLCPRWHRKPGYSQVSEVARKFQRQADAYSSLRRARTANQSIGERGVRQVPNPRVRLLEELPLSPTPSVQPRLLPPTPPRTPVQRLEAETGSESASLVSVSSRSSSTQHAPQRTQAQPQSQPQPRPQPRPQALTQSNQQQQPTPPSSTLSSPLLTPTSSSPTSSRRNSDTSTTSTQSITQPTPAQARPRPQTPPATPPTPTPTSTTPSSPISTVSPPLRRPTPRKPTTDPCPICYESLTPSTSIYCRRQCGTNVHRDCFREWRQHCLMAWDDRHPPLYNESVGEYEQRMMARDQEAVKCVYCRQKWLWEWEEE